MPGMLPFAEFYLERLPPSSLFKHAEDLQMPISTSLPQFPFKSCVMISLWGFVNANRVRPRCL